MNEMASLPRQPRSDPIPAKLSHRKAVAVAGLTLSSTIYRIFLEPWCETLASVRC